MKEKVEWKALIEEQARSGKSISDFCRERGITDNRFFYWRKRLQVPAAEGKFILLGEPKLVEVELAGGIKVRCAIEDLKAVVNVLRA